MSDKIINYHNTLIPFEDVVWRDALDGAFSVHGLYRPLELKKYQRLPDELLADESINTGARAMGLNTAGGRIRFATDSPYVAVAAELPRIEAAPHQSIVGSSGIDLYEDGRYRVSMFPGMSKRWGRPLPVDGMPTDFTSPASFAGGYEFPDRPGEIREITLYLPLYNGVSRVCIGLAPGAKLLPPKPYRYALPVVTYGSSITQGACASRPGNAHMSFLSRILDCDFINLGFSGADKGEPALAKWIGSLPMSVFINGYGANSPSPEHLLSTHAPFHRLFREGNPNVPVVFLSMPTNPYKAANFPATGKKSEIVGLTALEALKNGERIRFINGENVYGLDWENCTADGSHPNDLGFYRIAQALAPAVEQFLTAR